MSDIPQPSTPRADDASASPLLAQRIVLAVAVLFALQFVMNTIFEGTDGHLAAPATSLIAILVALAMVPQWYRDGGISIFKFLLFNLFPIAVWLGVKWLLGPRLIPYYSVLLPPGTQIRIVSRKV